MNGSIRRRRLERVNWVDSGKVSLDLMKDYGIAKPIANLLLRFAGRVTATGGGAISGLSMDASVQLMAARLILVAQHNQLGEVEIVNLSGQKLCQLWHFVNDLLGIQQQFTDPTPGAGANADFLREFNIPLYAPWSVNPFGTYLDPRDLTSLQLQIEFPVDDVYASTNFSAASLATIEVSLDEIEIGIPAGAPYCIPTYKCQQHPAISTTQDMTAQGTQLGGFIPILSLQPFDSSAVGNAQRDVAGLIRRVSMELDGQDILKKATWDNLALESELMFGLNYTTGRRFGPISVLCDRARNYMAMLDNRGKAIQTLIDTEFVPQQGTTAIVAAAGDRLDVMALSLLPNKAAKEVFRANGYNIAA